MNKKFLKTICLTLCVLILSFTFVTTVFAEDTSEITSENTTEGITEPLTEPEIETEGATSDYALFTSKLETYANTGYTSTLVYTTDSVKQSGISLIPYTDFNKFETGFKISSELDMGIVIYDNPETPIIDGIRINGNEITSLTIPIDLDNPQDYIVEVRLVYADSLFGTLAKISDETFNIDTILEEPLLYMQLLYYAIAALSLIVGGIGMATSRKKKIKTADDIAELVDKRVQEGCETFAIAYADVLKENLLPIFKTTVDTNQAVIKAISLSTSKAKEAPVALLDLLQEVSNVDVEHAIEEAREQVLKNIADADSKRHSIHEALTHIAEGTYQEAHYGEFTPETSKEQENSETQKPTETKSIF